MSLHEIFSQIKGFNNGDLHTGVTVDDYHIYQSIWSSGVGEVFYCERKPTNSQDRYTVAVKNDETSKVVAYLLAVSQEGVLSVVKSAEAKDTLVIYLREDSQFHVR